MLRENSEQNPLSRPLPILCIIMSNLNVYHHHMTWIRTMTKERRAPSLLITFLKQAWWCCQFLLPSYCWMLSSQHDMATELELSELWFLEGDLHKLGPLNFCPGMCCERAHRALPITKSLQTLKGYKGRNTSLHPSPRGNRRQLMVTRKGCSWGHTLP